MNQKDFFRLTREEQWRVVVANLKAAEDATVYARAEADKVRARLEDSALIKERDKFQDEAFKARAETQAALAQVEQLQAALAYCQDKLKANGLWDTDEDEDGQE